MRGERWEEGWRVYVKFLATVGGLAVAALGLMVLVCIFLYAIAVVLGVGMNALVENTPT